MHAAVKCRDGNCRREGARTDDTTSTTKGTKDHEEFHSLVGFLRVTRVLRSDAVDRSLTDCGLDVWLEVIYTYGLP